MENQLLTEVFKTFYSCLFQGACDSLDLLHLMT
jgi:hypothetical protein